MNRKSLNREEVKKVINGNGNVGRVPMLYNMWIYPGIYGESISKVERLLSEYPYDIQTFDLTMPDVCVSESSNGYSWTNTPMIQDTGAIDSFSALEEWDTLDEILANFPDPYNSKLISGEKPEKGEKYLLVRWWYWLFERLWSIRGMENALTDFLMYPDEVHKLFRKLTDFYLVAIERAKNELGADGIFTSDDIGAQTSSFFSNKIFCEFFKPYYKEIIDKCHSLGMHMWMHTCGNIEEFIPDLIEIGLDVLHPIQKHTMDEVKIAKQYGDKICILGGFDVQQTIPYGTVEEVREEVRHLIDAYANKNGRFMLTAGNGSTPDWRTDSIEALLDETYSYGIKKINSIDA